MEKTKEIVNKIPGGWYGNDAGFLTLSPKRGIVIVDAKEIVKALAWLKKRANIVDTAIQGDGGLMIRYDLR